MNRLHARTLSLGLLLGAAAPAFAAASADSVADAASVAPGAVDEAIVVTARRRSEAAQDVPIALSVVNSAMIEDTGTFNVARLTQLQPSLQFITSNPRNSALNIRGIGAPFGLTNDGIEQGVGLYVDQVYYARIGAGTLDFVDIDQVEVLRGPQGTLYGKNTTSGALNITTRKPSFDLEGRGEVSYGNLDYVQFKGSVSGPLAETVAARLSTSVTKRRGTLFNTISDRHVNELDNLGIRGQLLWRPTDTIDVTISGDYNRQNPEGFAQNYVKVVPTARAVTRQYANLARLSNNYVPPSADPFDRLVDNDSALDAKQVIAGASVLVNWDLGAATATSITAWREWTWRPSNDRDFTGLPITTVSANPSDQSQWSQELRLTSNGDRTIDYTVGVFAFHQKIQTDGVQVQGSSAALWLLGPTATNPALLDGLRSDNDIGYKNDSAAVFGKLTWNLSGRLSLQPGVRINYDRKDGSYIAAVSGGLTPATPAQQAQKNGVLQSQNYSAEFEDWNVSGDITASFKAADDVLLYGTYAKSFKSGGINLSGIPTRADGVTPATEVASVKPESVNHYELGLKSQFLDRAVTLNLAAFRTDIKDFQVTVVNGSVGVIRGYLANAEQVRSQGVELDLALRPSTNFSAYANLAYTDAEYVSFVDAPPPIELSGGALQVVDASGGVLPGVSKYALSYGAEYSLPSQAFGAGAFYLGIDGSYRSDFSSSPTPSKVQNVDGCVLNNVRAGFRSDSGWEAFGWVRNAFDTEYFDFLTAAPGSTGLIVGQPGDPRTYGLTVKAKF